MWRPDDRSNVAGLLPILVVALITGALLYGTGNELPFVEGLRVQPGTTDTRDAVAWLAGIAIVLLIAAPLLRLATAARLRSSGPLIMVGDRLQDRYGFSLKVLWPRLEASLEAEPMRAVATARSLAQRTTSVAVGWLLSCVGAVLTAGLFFGASVLLAVVAAGAALAAIQAKPRAWEADTAYADAIHTTVDLHRLALFDAVGWRRPRDPNDERLMFEALVEALDGSPDKRAGHDFRRAPGSPDALDVIDELKRSIGTAVDDALVPAVRETLRAAVAGPEFIDFDGWISARLLSAEAPLAFDDDGIVRLDSAADHTLQLEVGEDVLESALSARLRVRGGIKRHEVPFTVSVESNAGGFDTIREEIEVDADGGPPWSFSVRVPVAPPRGSDLWFWVRVGQHNRTLQNLEVRATVPATLS